jgi:S-adenosylmethionine synthetase
MSRRRHWLFTTEAVAPGHPDKACDQISDLVVDFFLDRNPDASVSAETMMSERFLAICGEFKAEQIVVEEAKIVLPYRIRDLLGRLYPNGSGFDWAGAKKSFELKRQSADASKLGASRGQASLVGYACDETDELMPLPIALARKMMERQHKLFASKAFPIGSDARCQVTVRYDGAVPKSVDKVTLFTQHDAGVDATKLREFVVEEIIHHVIPPHLRSAQMVHLVNPLGRFVVGGPQGETGVSGRKAVADAYGGSAAHGGGSMSGKDPGQAERFGAYMARAMAKGVVMAGLATRCSVQLAYASGRSEPASLMVDFQGSATGSASESAVEKILASALDLTPAGVARLLNLRRPIYESSAALGPLGLASSERLWETLGAQAARDALERALGEKG